MGIKLALVRPISGIRIGLTMATHKERIENFEARLGGLQDSMSQMELGLNDKL